MGALFNPINDKSAITLSTPPASPYPTLARLVYSVPELFFRHCSLALKKLAAAWQGSRRLFGLAFVDKDAELFWRLVSQDRVLGTLPNGQ